MAPIKQPKKFNGIKIVPREGKMPDWVKLYLTPKQQTADPKFCWILMIRKSTLSPNAIFVAVMLWTYLGQNFRVYPSQETLAQACSLSERSIRNALYELRDTGWLFYSKTHRRSYGYSNEYFLCWPKADQIKLVGRQERQILKVNAGDPDAEDDYWASLKAIDDFGQFKIPSKRRHRPSQKHPLEDSL